MSDNKKRHKQTDIIKTSLKNKTSPPGRDTDMNITIEIDRMRLYAFHGVMEQEQRVGNFFEISARLTYPIPPADRNGNDDTLPVSDELGDTVNYAEVAEIIRHEAATPSRLLEHLAARIRAAILKRYPAITSGHIKVAKITPPIGMQLRSASATLEWQEGE